MGIFDFFKSKEWTNSSPHNPQMDVPIPSKKLGKKKAPTRITEGIPKRGGLVNPSDEAITKRPKAPPAQKAKKPRKKKVIEPIAAPLTPQEIAKAEATRKGEPWVTVLDVEIDIDNISNGAFNLDWNDIFLAKLIRAGYKGKTDHDIVDQWFSDICRNILQENYEQEAADPDNRNRKDF